MKNRQDNRQLRKHGLPVALEDMLEMMVSCAPAQRGEGRVRLISLVETLRSGTYGYVRSVKQPMSS